MKPLAALLAAWCLAACGAGASLSLPPDPTRTPPPADTGWRPMSDGIAVRELAVTYQGRGVRLVMARVDPDRVDFRVRYDPEQPRRVSQWLEAEDARLIINAGFFDTDNRALGLLIADGAAFGRSYVDLGGLFGVAAGRVQIRSLLTDPYWPEEPFDQMVQSFPTLLTGDGAVNFQIRDDGRVAPRSVVAIDRQGRVVFLVSPLPVFSLSGLAAWLAQSDLDLASALNLDGGTSSGLLVRGESEVWGVDSWVPLPAVIVAR